MDRGRTPGTADVVAQPLTRWGTTHHGDTPVEVGHVERPAPTLDGVTDIKALINAIDAEHDGSFTIDLDWDVRDSGKGLRKPAWWGNAPTRTQLSKWVVSGLPAPLRPSIRFHHLEFHYSPSGTGAHLRGRAQMREQTKNAPWIALEARDTFHLRRILGDDPARLYYDVCRQDPQGWLSTMNRYAERGDDGRVVWKWKISR